MPKTPKKTYSKGVKGHDNVNKNLKKSACNTKGKAEETISIPQ